MTCQIVAMPSFSVDINLEKAIEISQCACRLKNNNTGVILFRDTGVVRSSFVVRHKVRQSYISRTGRPKSTKFYKDIAPTCSSSPDSTSLTTSGRKLSWKKIENAASSGFGCMSKIDCGIRTGNSNTAFNTLKLLTQRQHTKTNLIENAKSELLTENKAIHKRWTEYCTELYNYKLKTDASILESEDDVENRETGDSPILKEEVEKAVTVAERRQITRCWQHTSGDSKTWRTRHKTRQRPLCQTWLNAFLKSMKLL